MNPWQRKPRIGLSVKSREEWLRAIRVGADVLEIKTEKWAENGDHIWSFYNEIYFTPNARLLGELEIEAKANNLQVNLHLPIEREVNPTIDTGINIAFVEHHQIALKRLIFINGIFDKFGIGQVITMHPPTTSYNNQEVISEELALKNARIFFKLWDDYRRSYRHKSQVGLENQTDKKLVAGMLGYVPWHFKKMLRDTRTLGLTIDSGHRRLAENFSVTDFIGLGIPIVNFHFHGNQGCFSFENFDDDQHQVPSKENVFGYYNYIRYFRRHSPSVVLELSSLKDYSDEELAFVISDIRSKIEA